MRLLLSFLPCAMLLMSAAKAPACSILPRPNGVMCLDEKTGKPLWEYFPDQLGFFHVQSDAHHLFMVYQEYRNPDLSIKAEPASTIRAVNLVTGKEVVGPIQLPSENPPSPAANSWSNLVTAAGDRIAFSPGCDRAITVFQGDGPEVRTIISTGWYSRVVVMGNVIVYSPSYITEGEANGPTVIAVDSTNGNRLWEVNGAPEVHGLSVGENHLYISEEGYLRVVDPLTGRIVWRNPLPRIRGQSQVTEHDGRLFVNCDFHGDDPPMYFLYCLDAKTGNIQWTLNPGYMPFLFRDGRVYVMALPTRLMSIWRNANVMDSFQVSKTPKWHEARKAFIRKRFAAKTHEEIELNLRAWHALGDRSGLTVLESAAEVSSDQEIKQLASFLTKDFPAVRDPMRLMDFLENQFEQRAELRIEIRRILEDFNPVPFWMEEENKKYNALRRKPIQFELTSDERKLIDAFRELKGKADAAPVNRIDRKSLTELMLGQGSATFETLIVEHDASDDPQYRMLVRTAIYKQHPAKGSDWALSHMEEIGPTELSLWVQLASIEWLLAHEDLYRKWLFDEERSVQSFAAHRLSRLDDPTPVIPFCLQLLEERVSGAPLQENEAILGAIYALGKSKDGQHANVLRRFLSYKGVGQINNDMVVRDAAYRALKAIGQEVPVSAILAPQAPKVPAPKRLVDPYNLYIELEDAVNEGNDSKAKSLARQMLSMVEQDGDNTAMRATALAKAYEALEDWDTAIVWIQSEKDADSELVDRRLLEIFEKAKRWDEVDAVLTRTKSPELATKAALMLAMEGLSLDGSFEVLSRQLKDHPNDADICIALSVVLLKRDESQAADAMMERAIALRPRPEGSLSFAQTFLHWIKRGKPEKAIAWLRQSVAEDRKTWEREDLLDWVSQFSELKSTAAELRSSKQ